MVAAGASGGSRSLAAKPAATPASAAAQTVKVCGIGNFSADAADLQDIQTKINSIVENAHRQWLASILRSGDLRVRACEPFSGPVLGGSCGRINAEDWAAMDAENASPWLMIAGEAHAANDPTAEEAAYSRAATASRIDSYAWSLFGNVEPALPVSMTQLERYQLGNTFIGVESSIPQPLISQHCSAAAVSAPGVRSQCGALAELMVSKGTTLLDLLTGTAIGARVGWAADRLAALRDRKDAYMQLIMTRTASRDPKEQWTCDAINRSNAFMSDWARFGEIWALQQDLERSGRTTAELAQEYRAVAHP